MTPREFEKKMAEMSKKDIDPRLRHVQMETMLIVALRSEGYGKGCDIYNNTPGTLDMAYIDTDKIQR